MNKNIDQILEKYLAGQSSLQEEKMLKEYLLENDVDEKYLEYKLMFQVFDGNSIIKAPDIQFITERKLNDKKKKIILFISSIAAICLLSFLVYHYETTPKDCLVINGKKIENQDIIKSYAQAKIEKYHSIMEKEEKTVAKFNRIKEKINSIEIKKEKYYELINKNRKQ